MLCAPHLAVKMRGLAMSGPPSPCLADEVALRSFAYITFTIVDNIFYRLYPISVIYCDQILQSHGGLMYARPDIRGVPA